MKTIGFVIRGFKNIVELMVSATQAGGRILFIKTTVFVWTCCDPKLKHGKQIYIYIYIYIYVFVILLISCANTQQKHMRCWFVDTVRKTRKINTHAFWTQQTNTSKTNVSVCDRRTELLKRFKTIGVVIQGSKMTVKFTVLASWAGGRKSASQPATQPS